MSARRGAQRPTARHLPSARSGAIVVAVLLGGGGSSCKEPAGQCLDLAGERDPIPILERPTESPALSCLVSQGPREISAPTPTYAFAVAPFGDALYAVWTGDTIDGRRPLLWSPVAEGVVTDPVEIASHGYVTAAVADERGLAVLWMDPAGALFFTRVDPFADPPATSAPIALGSGWGAELTGLDGGYAVVLEGEVLTYVWIGEDGEVSRATPIRERVVRPAITATDEGLAVAFSDDRGCEFALLDPSGRLRSKTPIREPGPGETGSCSPSDVVVTEGGFFVAVHVGSEACESRLGPEGAEEPVRTLHLEIVRVDAEGQLLATPTPMTGARASVEESGARLLDMGQHLGVLWSRGSVVYECGGCVSDAELHFAVISQADLAPASNVVDLSADPIVAGLAPTHVLSRDQALLLAFEYRFHALYTVGIAEIDCQ